MRRMASTPDNDIEQHTMVKDHKQGKLAIAHEIDDKMCLPAMPTCKSPNKNCICFSGTTCARRLFDPL